MDTCGATVRDSRGRIQGTCVLEAGHDQDWEPTEHSTEGLRPIRSFLFDQEDDL